MIKQIPLKSGTKYTIYTMLTANEKPWKREITYLATDHPTKSFKAHRGARIGRHYPKDSSVSLTLIIHPEGDLIVAGWDHPDVVSTEANKLIFEGGFGVAFSLSLQNLNQNFTNYKSLYYLDRIRDSEASQVFPLSSPKKKRDLQSC